VMNEVSGCSIRSSEPLDEVLFFNPLGDELFGSASSIAGGQLNIRLIHRQVQIFVSPEARQWILDETCADRSYGSSRCAGLAEVCRRPLPRRYPGWNSEAGALQIYVRWGRLSFPLRSARHPGRPLANLTQRKGGSDWVGINARLAHTGSAGDNT